MKKKKILCASCQKRPAPIHEQYGPVWCEKCQKKYKPMVGRPWPEFTSEEIKENRKKYFKSILQPYRGGELSREFIEAHGADNVEATPEQIKKSKYVWRDLPGWRNRHKSL